MLKFQSSYKKITKQAKFSFVTIIRKHLIYASKNIRYWIISYNSQSYPVKEKMIELIEKFKKVKIYEHEYANNYGGKGSRKGTKEYLFYCYNYKCVN